MKWVKIIIVALLLLLSFKLYQCGEGKIDLSHNQAIPMSEPRPQLPCLDQSPLGKAYFGDLHVHTSYSSDGWMWGVRLTPQDAYRYAFGETVMLPPNDATDLVGTRPVKIDRPLDFAGVTDHSEFLAESRICIDDSFEAYQSEFCQTYRVSVGRHIPLAMRIFSPMPWRDPELCGDDGDLCKQVQRSVWQDTIDAAEDWNDSSEGCQRTTFIAYEYSSHRMGSNLHRNVIFRNSVVPPNPISYIEAPREWKLWEKLQENCLDSETGCDVLAIPHNSNISNGRMFAVDYPGASPLKEQAARAALRNRVEPLVEIMQHKGDSECRNGVGALLGAVDELCDFEKFENMAFEATTGDASEVGECYDGPLADYVPHKGPDCLSANSFVRDALTTGLKEEQRLGVNPFKFGLTASTDTHNGLAGGVTEKTFEGHIGMGDNTPSKRTAWSTEIPGNSSNSPGGLIGVWAPENTRDALFDAMKRKEVFGTSGPRIQPRFFAGWNYPENLCDDPEMLIKAYRGGVPMGGDMRPPQQQQSPRFLVTALADVDTEQMAATPLQKLQIIKGWIDDEGNNQQRIFDVAGDGNNGAAVDLDSCEQQGKGFAQLCAVWSDPEFDADKRAVYYLRAVENPSCRYSAWACAMMPEDQRPADCQLPEVRRSQQERAWSSPIWYTPEG